MFSFFKKLSGGNEDSTTKSNSEKVTVKSNTNSPNESGVKSIGKAKKPVPTIGKPKQPPTLHIIQPEPITELKHNANLIEKENFLIKEEKTHDEFSQPKEILKVDRTLEKTITITSCSAIEEEVATIFSEGDDESAIKIIKDYLKKNKDKVEPRDWFILMDLYQITGNIQEFDKTALSFAQSFGTSPPSWFGEKPNTQKKENVIGSKNMIILDQILDDTYSQKFRDLYKSAKQENFCRINVSQCKFEQNSPVSLDKFLKLLVDLKRTKVISILMGDNNLLHFCKKYIEDEGFKKTVTPAIIENDQVVWLLYLEVLQWKGQSEEFEKIALNYAEKFEVSPPGWSDSDIMDLSKLGKEQLENLNSLVLEKNLNINNVAPLLQSIKEQFEIGNHAEIDLSKVNRIDFAAAGAISFHIQELWSSTEHSNKNVILKNPNELIIILLHMVGATEFLHIIPRNRK